MTIEVNAVTPRLWHIPLPLTNHNVGHVNVYALEGDDGLLLVDTGWKSEWDALDARLQSIGWGIEDVVGVLVSHLHVDHCGLAAELQSQAGAWIGMHDADASLLDARYFDRGPYEEAWARWIREVGAPDALLRPALAQVADLAGRIEEFKPDLRLEDGDVISHGPWSVTAIATPGHSPGHLCFFDAPTGTLFTGDHIFPWINVSPSHRPQSPLDSVDGYLRSLDRLERLAVPRVLPGHQRPFFTLVERIAALREYHRKRLAEVQGIAAPPGLTVWEAARHVKRSRDWDELSDAARLTALGETYAHLLHLAQKGRADATADVPMRWTARR